MSMTKNQKIVVDYLSNTGHDFLSDLAELEGAYDSIPDEVHEAFSELSDKQKIEVVRNSASNLLKSK